MIEDENLLRIYLQDLFLKAYLSAMGEDFIDAKDSKSLQSSVFLALK